MPNDKMKILIIGLYGANSEILFGDERLTNFRRLMEFGCYGSLEGFKSSSTVHVWLAIVTGQIPHLSDKTDWNHADIEIAHEKAIWAQIEAQGMQAIVVGMPPGIYYPLEVTERLGLHLDEEDVIEESHAVNIDEAKSQVFDASQLIFDRVRQLLQNEKWGYFQFVDTGINRLFTSSASDKLGESFIRDYYIDLDEQIGSILEFLTDDTIVLVVSVPRLSEQQGGFILASVNNPIQGEVGGTHILDIAPTLLDLGGYDVPPSMQGRSLLASQSQEAVPETGLTEEDEELLRERLSGLGYI